MSTSTDTELHVLVDQDRIPIRIDQDEARGPLGALIGLGLELDPLSLQLALVFAHIRELP